MAKNPREYFQEKIEGIKRLHGRNGQIYPGSI